MKTIKFIIGEVSDTINELVVPDEVDGLFAQLEDDNTTSYYWSEDLEALLSSQGMDINKGDMGFVLTLSPMGTLTTTPLYAEVEVAAVVAPVLQREQKEDEPPRSPLAPKPEQPVDPQQQGLAAVLVPAAPVILPGQQEQEDDHGQALDPVVPTVITTTKKIYFINAFDKKHYPASLNDFFHIASEGGQGYKIWQTNGSRHTKSVTSEKELNTFLADQVFTGLDIIEDGAVFVWHTKTNSVETAETLQCQTKTFSRSSSGDLMNIRVTYAPVTITDTAAEDVEQIKRKYLTADQTMSIHYLTLNQKFLLAAWNALGVRLTKEQQSTPPEPTLRTKASDRNNPLILDSKKFKQFKQAYLKAFMAHFALSTPLPETISTDFPEGLKTKNQEMTDFIAHFMSKLGNEDLCNCLVVERDPNWQNRKKTPSDHQKNGPTDSAAELLRFARLFYPSTRESITDEHQLLKRHNRTTTVKIANPNVSKEILVPGYKSKKTGSYFDSVTSDGHWDTLLESIKEVSEDRGTQLNHALMAYARSKVPVDNFSSASYATLGNLKDAYLEAAYRYFDSSNSGLTDEQIDKDAYYLLQTVQADATHLLKYRRTRIGTNRPNTDQSNRYQRYKQFVSHLAHVSLSSRSLMAHTIEAERNPSEKGNVKHQLLTEAVTYQVKTDGFKSTVSFSRQGEIKRVLEHPSSSNLHYYVTKNGVQYIDIQHDHPGVLADRPLKLLTSVFTCGLTSANGETYDKKTYVERVAHYFDPAHHAPEYQEKLKEQAIAFLNNMVNNETCFARLANNRFFKGWRAKDGLTNAYKDLLLFFADKFGTCTINPSSTAVGEQNVGAREQPIETFCKNKLRAAYITQKKQTFFQHRLISEGTIKPTYLKRNDLSVDVNKEGMVSIERKNRR